jgi:hypothetical protein
MNEIDSLADAPLVLRRPRRRWGRLVVGTVIIAFLLSFAVVAARRTYITHQAQQDLDAVVAELDRTDPGWRLDELEAARAPVADEKNAALAVMKVCELLPKGWSPSRPNTQLECQFTSEQLASLQQDLKPLAEALGQAKKLGNYSLGRFPAEPSQDPLDLNPNCERAFDAVLLLQLQAKLLAQENDGKAALEAVLGMLAVARSVGDEPNMLAQMIRQRCQAEALATIARILAQTQPDADLLRKVQTVLEEEDQEPLMLIAMRGERAGHHQIALAAEADNSQISKVLTRVTPGDSYFNEQTLTLSSGAVLRKSHAQMLRYVSQFVEFAKLPVEEQGRTATQLASQRTPVVDGYELFLGLDQRLRGMPIMFRRQKALLRCGIVALAAERYRIANKQWPDSIHSLVPGQLSEVLADPFGSKPIQFQREKDGVTIFSIGLDPPASGAALPPGARSTYRLWDSDKRRQAPRPDEQGFQSPFGRR